MNIHWLEIAAHHRPILFPGFDGSTNIFLSKLVFGMAVVALSALLMAVPNLIYCLQHFNVAESRFRKTKPKTFVGLLLFTLIILTVCSTSVDKVLQAMQDPDRLARKFVFGLPVTWVALPFIDSVVIHMIVGGVSSLFTDAKGWIRRHLKIR